MSAKNDADREALAAAIAMEEKAYSFFTESASKAKDNLARDVFEFLASEELNHIKTIKKFRDRLSGSKTGDSEVSLANLKQIDQKDVFQQLFKQLRKDAPVEGGQLDVYRFAMDFEKKSEAFYEKALAETTSPDAQKLYRFLIGEERKHFKILESCLLYFENPAEFFHQQEGWHLEA